MPESLPPNLSSADLPDHCPSKAWTSLGGARNEPERVDVLQIKKKSAIYRLFGIGPRQSAVIAKRCSCTAAGIERVIYEQVLPQLGLPFIQCYGFVEDRANESGWLFLEDVEGERFSPDNDSHRAAAGLWLAKLHSSARFLELRDCLPSREFAHYLASLRSLRSTLQSWLNRSILPDTETVVVESIISACDELESHWCELEAMCFDLPSTVVHGDFVRKNLRLRSGTLPSALLVFDWEYSGWGVPAADLVQFVDGTASPDLESYRSAISPNGSLALPTIKRWADCGRFFRLLDNLAWACAAVQPTDHRQLAKPISYLRIYQRHLLDALQLTPWATKHSALSYA